MNEQDKQTTFRQQVIHCANTGELVQIPDDMDKQEAGNIMADVASFFLDRREDIKAIIILKERRRLRV